MSDPRLDRLVPPDWRHKDKYPLTAATMPAEIVPVAIGVPWYRNFSHPERDKQGRYWIGRGPNWGPIDGGHCVCLLPRGLRDLMAWYLWYDQHREGACVGFGISRKMSLLNRVRYDSRWLWNEAKLRDIWPDTNPGDNNGTSMRAGFDVVRDVGHRRMRAGKSAAANLADGISENRWAQNAQQVLDALGRSDEYAVPILNSWGRSYPHIVYMPATTLDRLNNEDGEMGLITDRKAA